MATNDDQKPAQENPTPSPSPQVGPAKPEPERVLFSWRAASRPFRKRTREFWVRIIAIAAILGTILFIAEGTMPVILMISIIFLYYILSTVEPEQIEYSITNKGIKIIDKTTVWDFFTRYWFTRRLGSEILVLETIMFPRRLELVVNKEDKEKIKKELNKYISEEEVPPSGLDRAANWLAKRMQEND